MINEKSLKAVKNSSFSSHFCKPLYSSYCFSKIPATIESLLSTKESSKSLPMDTITEGPFDHVILLFLDGFGWSFFEKYKSKLPILQKLEKEGIVSKLTSLFPSTTAAHVTCINTGLLPQQTGIYEWFIYDPILHDIIAPLPFSFAGDRKGGTLPLNPKELFPKQTLYQRLTREGVQCRAFMHSSVIDSPYSRSVLDAAERCGYKKASLAFEQILAGLKGRTYTYFYYGEIDAIGHRKGIYSREFSQIIEKIFGEIESFIQALPPKTVILLTADHGMVEVIPEQTFYLNKKIPNVDKYLQFGRREKPLAPAGSCRDFFLHANPDTILEFKEILEMVLERKAEVYLTEDLMKEGLFGLESPSENFLRKVGNLVILPYKGEAVWWYEKNRFEQNFLGAHGGLTREEMEIPLLFYKTSSKTS